MKWSDLNKILREPRSFVRIIFNQLLSTRCNCRKCGTN